MDNFSRQIQVWALPEGGFCAVLKYQGSFTTVAGTSPGGNSTVGAGVKGTFEGGYRSTVFTGALKSVPAVSTRGNIGLFNYGCDPLIGQSSCSGYVDWTTLYFDSVSGFDLAWWGWVYHGGNNGSWVNAIPPPTGPGNSGDIIGS